MRHQANPLWSIADRLHDSLCRHGHGMDQCWGLYLPYDQNMAEMSMIQARYVQMAEKLVDLCEADDELIDGFLDIIGQGRNATG